MFASFQMHFQFSASELFIGMLVVLAAVALVADMIRVAYPILLVLAGLVMGLIPAVFPGIYGDNAKEIFSVKPELIFLIFLPPLLYYAGLMTDWRDFKVNLRPISELAVGLVLATMAVVAVVAHYVFPHMGWPAAFLLGAIVSPPDAVAATAVLSKLKVPKSIVTILEGESLVNDATALVAYRVALVAILTGSFSLGETAWNVIVIVSGGIAVGLVAAYLAVKLLEKIDAPTVESTLTLLVPYGAFIPAEKLGGSGILAAVAAGIYMGRRLPEFGSPRQRLRTMAVWDCLVFILNGFIFIQIGLQLYDLTIRGRAHMSVNRLMAGSLAVTLAAVIVRIIWVFSAAYLPRLIPAVRRAERKPHWTHVTVVSWAGMRGIVTLAAAFALPDKIGEAPFLEKDIILFVSFAVILVTLVFQGSTLAPLIRLLGIKVNADDDQREEVQARLDAAHAAISRLSVLSFDESINPELISRVRLEYEERINRLGGTTRELDLGIETEDESLQKIRQEALIAERKMITFMRDQNILGDEILRRILQEIDLEEAKLIPENFI